MPHEATLISTIWSYSTILLANDEGDKAPHEHDDAPPQPQLQPQGPPPMNPLDPLIPQIMNVIQQGMQVGMASFHSSYN
jgi:hypothetical protein